MELLEILANHATNAKLIELPAGSEMCMKRAAHFQMIGITVSYTTHNMVGMFLRYALWQSYSSIFLAL